MSATLVCALVIAASVIGLERNFTRPWQAWCLLIGQIKLTRIHVLLLFLPGVRVKRAVKHLFTMSKDPAAFCPEGQKLPNLLSLCDVSFNQ